MGNDALLPLSNSGDAGPPAACDRQMAVHDDDLHPFPAVSDPASHCQRAKSPFCCKLSDGLYHRDLWVTRPPLLEASRCTSSGPATYTEFRFLIMTNGMLFHSNECVKCPGIHRRVDKLKIRFDAASKSTNERLSLACRREMMLENLTFAGKLWTEFQLFDFELVFVVWQDNYPKMGDVCDLAKRVGTNIISFFRITTWVRSRQPSTLPKRSTSPAIQDWTTS